MAWTAKQRQVFGASCRAAQLSEQHRQLLLRQCDHALHEGRLTSTSPRLTQEDFERLMSQVEAHAGGQLPGYTPGYWNHKSGHHLGRMRHVARGIARELEAAGKLHADGAGLAGWIRTRVSGGRTDRLEELTWYELNALLTGLRDLARRSGVILYDQPRRTRAIAP